MNNTARAWLDSVDIADDYDTLRDAAHRGTPARILVHTLDRLILAHSRLEREIASTRRRLDDTESRLATLDTVNHGAAAQDATQLATAAAEFDTLRDTFGTVARVYTHTLTTQH